MRRCGWIVLLALSLPFAARADPPRHEDVVPAGPSLEARLAEIQQRVQAVAVYPPIAEQRAVEGEAHVAFALDAAGRAEDVSVARSSGHLALDAAARRAVVDAGVLPRVFGRVTVPVRFTLGPAADVD